MNRTVFILENQQIVPCFVFFSNSVLYIVACDIVREVDGPFRFLDVWVEKVHFVTRIYRKPTFFQTNSFGGNLFLVLLK